MRNLKISKRLAIAVSTGLVVLAISGAAFAVHHSLVAEAQERGKERALRDSAAGLCLPDDYDSSQYDAIMAEKGES